MGNEIKKRTIFSNRLTAFIIISLSLTGCASTASTQPYALPALLSEDVRARLVKVGIAHAQFQPKTNIRKPMGKGQGALAGMGGGAAATVAAGASTADPFGLLLGIVLAPVGAVVGGVAGAVQGEPAVRRKEADKTIDRAIAELKVQETMSETLVELARRKTSYEFELIEAEDPSGSRTDYGHRREKGLDAIIEIGVTEFGLSGEGINHPIQFFMDTQVAFKNVPDGKELSSFKIRYTGAGHKYVEWAANDGKLFKEEFLGAYRILAGKIIDELFLLYMMPEFSEGYKRE